MRWLAFMEAVGRLYPSGPEAGFQSPLSALPPANGLPSFRLLRYGLDGQRTLIAISDTGTAAKVYKAYATCHNNAVALIADAELLFGAGRFARACALAIIA